MGADISTAGQFFMCRNSWCDHCSGEDASLRDALQQTGPKLLLRVVSAPIEASMGAKVGTLAVGDEITVESMEKGDSWAPLLKRHDANTLRARASSSVADPSWPPGSGENGRAPKHYWRTKVMKPLPNNKFDQMHVMLQTAVVKSERVMSCVEQDLKDCKDASSYALKFNQQQIRANRASGRKMGEQGPRVVVAAPVACIVLQSSVPMVAGNGDYVTVTPCNPVEITKFVFDGTEEYIELPQAFFHFAFQASAGKELVCDLQGEADDDSLCLVDPVVLRAPAVGVASLLAVAMEAMSKQESSDTPTTRHFHGLHTKCGPMCRVFDPNRSAGKNNCGLGGFQCGLAGA